MVRLISIMVFVLGVVTSPTISPATENDTLTGCLSPSGLLGYLQEGEEPLRPCRGRATQVTIPSTKGGNGGVTVPFFVTLEEDGEEAVIAQHGPLTLFARFNVETNTIGARTIIYNHVRIFVTSTQAGWFARDYERNAHEEVMAGSVRAVDEGAFYSNFGRNQFANIGTVLGPAGEIIGIFPKTGGLGLEIFGHRCVAFDEVTVSNLPIGN